MEPERSKVLGQYFHLLISGWFGIEFYFDTNLIIESKNFYQNFMATKIDSK